MKSIELISKFVLLTVFILSSCMPSAEQSVPTTVVRTLPPTIMPRTTATTVPKVTAKVATPTPLAKRPRDVITSYWSLVSNRNYKSAWRLLSDGFQQRKHKGNFSDYQHGYQEMTLCSVKTTRIKTLTENERNARVTARTTYRLGKGCAKQINFDFEFLLIYETQQMGWQIDMVTPVDNPDISLDGATSCGDSMVTVLASSLNVRTGPGAGRAGETSHKIKSYLQRGECVSATATDENRSWVRIANTPRIAAEGGWVAVSFLEFGDTHPELAVLPLAKEPAPKPTSTQPSIDLSQPIGIEHLRGENYVCYNIQGSNVVQLAKQMDRLGPFDSDGNKVLAVTSIKQFETNGGSCYSDGTADLSDVKVTVKTTITMPCWYPQSGTSQKEVSKCNHFMQALALHELRHVEIAWQHASTLEQRYRDANTCDDATLDRISDQVFEDHEVAQVAFHTSPEGQPIPLP